MSLPSTSTFEGDDTAGRQTAIGDLLWSGRNYLLLCVALSLCCAWAYLWATAPVFEADALLHVDEPQAALGGLEEVTELFSGEATEAETDMQLLRSRTLMRRVIEQQQLDIEITPTQLPIIGNASARRWQGDGLAEPKWGMDDHAWGGETLEVSQLSVPGVLLGKDFVVKATGDLSFDLLMEGKVIGSGSVGEPLEVKLEEGVLTLSVASMQARSGQTFTVKRQQWLTVAAALKRRFSISEQGRGTGILELRLRSGSALEAANTLNAIAEDYLQRNVRQRTEQAARSLEFVESQLPLIRQATEQAEAEMNRYRRDNQAVDFSLEAQKVLEQLVELEQEQAQLELRRGELITEFTERHPLLVNVDGQLARVARERATLEVQLKTLPQTQQEMLGLSRDVEVNSALYTLLLNKSQELRIMKAGTVGNVRIVDRAEPPLAPIEPRAALVFAVAVLLGLAAGFLWLLRRETRRHGIDDPRAIETQANLPLYAVIPHSKDQAKLTKKAGSKRQLPVLVERETPDIAAESLRSLRTSLHFLLKGEARPDEAEKGGRAMMITGPMPGVGKTFVSINLAHLLAESGQKVVVIDADMRRGHMHRYLGETRGPGLSECLIGDVEFDAAVRRLDNGLHCLTAGSVPPNPAALLLDGGMRELVGKLRLQYDLVLIDTPPIIPVSDPLIIADYVDASMLVVKSHATPMDEIEECQRRFARSGLSLSGAIVNDTPLGSTSAGYRNGYYRYQYQYS